MRFGVRMVGGLGYEIRDTDRRGMAARWSFERSALLHEGEWRSDRNREDLYCLESMGMRERLVRTSKSPNHS